MCGCCFWLLYVKKLKRKKFYVTYKSLYGFIGQKFPGKGLEVSLQASVHFYNYPIEGYASAEKDPFCAGSNAYIDVRKFSYTQISICLFIVYF